jgi:hypothetical protein
MKDSNAQEKICPLCGGDNECAVAAGKPPDSCWCKKVTISPKALAAIPVESVDKYCLCPACGRLKEEAVVEG